MLSRESIVTSLIAGAAVGTVVLGLFGRLAMAGVALADGSPLNLSFSGLAQVVVYGAVLGGVGGLVALPTRSHFPANRHLRSVIVAAVLFVGSFLFPLVRGRISLGPRETQLFVLVVAAAVFLIYASTLDSLMNRIERGRKGEE
jgi:hypothetical protein